MSQRSVMPVWPARHTRSVFVRLAMLVIPVSVLTAQDKLITASSVWRLTLEPEA